MLKNGAGFVPGDDIPPSVMEKLITYNFDPGCLRPFNYDGQTWITLNADDPDEKKHVYKKVQNAVTVMTKDQYLLMDNEIVTAARAELELVKDIRGAGCVFNLPNGMAHTMLQYQTASNTGPAHISMDALDESYGERPTFDTANLPLPLIHKAFGFPWRQLLTSRNGPTPIPLDTFMASQAGEACAEYLEYLTAGKAAAFKFQGAYVYGMTNHPQRLTYTLTAPTAPGWTPQTLLTELLACRQILAMYRFKGPFNVYCDRQWDEILDQDWSGAKGDISVRDRLTKVARLNAIKSLDALDSYEIVFLEMRKRTVEMVDGMGIRTVQWDQQGGLAKMWKVLMLQVPRFRTDQAGNMGCLVAKPA